MAAYSVSAANAERFEADRAQSVLNNLLPKGLAKYFFYPGETLAFPFKDDKKSQDNLGEFLREVSGSSKFAPFATLIDTAHKQLAAKSKRHADADLATKTLPVPRSRPSNARRQRRKNGSHRSAMNSTLPLRTEPP